MKKLIWHFVLLILISCLQLKFLGIYNLKNELLNNLILIFTIIFGFYITSFAIFATSKYVSSLYKIVDKKDMRLTLLNTLLNNYKHGLFIVLFSILYLLMLEFILLQTNSNQLQLSNFSSLPLLFVILLNFFYTYKMLKDLSQIILQEAKGNIE